MCVGHWVANARNVEQMREISGREQMRETFEVCTDPYYPHPWKTPVPAKITINVLNTPDLLVA